MSVRFDDAVELASPDLEELIRRVTAMKWLFPFLAGLWLGGPATTGKPVYWQWTAGAGACLGTLGFLGIAVYEHNRFSVRALLVMMDVTRISLGLLMLIGFEEMARCTAYATYQLIVELRHVCAAVGIATFVFAAFGAPWASVARGQISEFRSYIPQRTITAAEVFEILMRRKGTRETFHNWGPRRFAAIMGPVSVATLGIVALGHSKYFLFELFLIGLVMGPLLAGLGVGHTLRYFRGMGMHDLEICFLTPPRPRDRIYWKDRVTENYSALGKLMRFGLYAELAVFAIFGAMSSLGGRTPWPFLAALGIWTGGTALILVDNRRGAVRGAAQVGWLLVHLPLLFVCIYCVISLLR
jgi:hypothetical protein